MEKVGEGFYRNLGGKCINLCYKIKKYFILALMSLIMYWLYYICLTGGRSVRYLGAFGDGSFPCIAH